MSKENLEIITIPGTRNGQRILELRGRLTIETVFGLQDTIRRENTPELILDMRAVPYMDSIGLGVLVAAYVRAQKNSRKLAFVGMNARVKAVMDMSHLSQFFRIYSTMQEAQAALSKGE